MRYHWGLAVGHLYTHHQAVSTTAANGGHSDDTQALEVDAEELEAPTSAHEFLLGARDDDDWDGSDDDLIHEEVLEVEGEENLSDTEMFAAVDE